jgi:N6-adenosine-specific RNA methylase IME4
VITLPRTRGGWRCVIADPAWSFNDRNTRGAAARHYETMTGPQICNMPVREVVAANAVLGLWAPELRIHEDELA